MSGVSLWRSLTNPVVSRTQYWRGLSSSAPDGRTKALVSYPVKDQIQSLSARVKVIKPVLSLEEFRATHLETLNEYSNSAIVKEALGKDTPKIKMAYNEYCRARYFEYQRSLVGGSPSRLI